MTQGVKKFGLLILAGVLTACAPEGGCRSTVTGNDNSVHQACGGSGESSPATVTTPAPVVVPPTVIQPVIVTDGAPVE